MKALLPFLLLVACGCPQKPTPTPAAPTTMPTPAQPPAQPPAQQPPAQQPPTQQPPAQTAAPGIGETCGAGDSCAQGLTCVKYFGIAGPRGGEFKSCEVRCSASAGCPAGHNCITIADGPGQVCRK